MTKKLLFGVVGHPIDHSLSPIIHESFAKQCGLNVEYKKYNISPFSNQFEQFLVNFFEEGGRGLNITSPFKQRAYEFVHQLSERAQWARAVNTIIPLSPHQFLGDNTDGLGLINDLINGHKKDIFGQSILILGSGGAAEGILAALNRKRPSKIMIATRDKAKVQDKPIIRRLYQDIKDPFDLIINATPLSLYQALPPISSIHLHKNTFCYDLVYHKNRETPFTLWAKKQGVSSSDGLGMLIEQAAESFYQWHGVYPKNLDPCFLLPFLK